MRLFPRRRTREYATPVRRSPTGFSFQMSPGVTITVSPDDPEYEWFAEQLAKTIQRVAQEEWT